MSENELLEAVLEMAALLGWRCYHARPARTASGWRTAAQGNGAAGFPDLVLVRNGCLWFVELKAEKGRVGPAQELWLDALKFVPGVRVDVWRPDDWRSGRVEAVLRG